MIFRFEHEILDGAVIACLSAFLGSGCLALFRLITAYQFLVVWLVTSQIMAFVDRRRAQLAEHAYNLEQQPWPGNEEFTPEFFDEASAAWRANKIRIGEGSYRYKRGAFSVKKQKKKHD